MSAEKKYTERDMIVRERRAFVEGANYGATGATMRIYSEAEHRYPLPKVTRPRVVTDEYGDLWKFENGVFRWSNCHKDAIQWEHVNPAWAPTATLVTLWAALLANPTETVEVEP